MAELPLPAGLSAGTFPTKLWRLVNDPRIHSVRWDSEAQGLLVDRSLFEWELLSPGSAQGPAPHAFRATQFCSSVRQLNRYSFHKVPGWAGAAAPGHAGAWLHYRKPWFRRDHPDLQLRIRRRSAADTQRRAAGPEGRRRPPCGSQQLPGPRPLPDEQHGCTRFKPLPRERPPLAQHPPCGFHLLHRERPGPARREGPSRFRELYGERPLPAKWELLRVPHCHFHGFHGERLLPLGWEGPSSRMQELYREQPLPLDRELLRMQPCSFQQLHREQQPPASNPPAALGTSAPHAPAGSAGCAASTASSSGQNAPAEKESPELDLGLAIEKMIREIRSSLPVKPPSDQGNINVGPESPRQDTMNRAAAEEASSGTESCGSSSPEPEEPGLKNEKIISTSWVSILDQYPYFFNKSFWRARQETALSGRGASGVQDPSGRPPGIFWAEGSCGPADHPGKDQNLLELRIKGVEELLVHRMYRGLWAFVHLDPGDMRGLDGKPPELSRPARVSSIPEESPNDPPAQVPDPPGEPKECPGLQQDATRAFDQLKKALMSAPALGLPNVSKPFFLFSHEKQGIALGILAQNLGPYWRAVAYLSKQLDTAAKGWPGCLRAVAAVAINIQEARKFTLGQKMTVLVSHTMSAVLEAKGGHWLSPQRFLKYQAILVEQDDVEIVVTNVVNPASFLSGSMGEPVIHDCLETIEATYSSRPELKDTPLEDAETWFTDGSSYVVSGRRHAGYAVTTSKEVCTEYHKNETKITPPVPRKAVITKMPAIPEVEKQITPVVTKIGPYAIKKTGVQKLIVNPKGSLTRVEMGVQPSLWVKVIWITNPSITEPLEDAQAKPVREEGLDYQPTFRMGPLGDAEGNASTQWKEIHDLKVQLTSTAEKEQDYLNQLLTLKTDLEQKANELESLKEKMAKTSEEIKSKLDEREENMKNLKKQVENKTKCIEELQQENEYDKMIEEKDAELKVYKIRQQNRLSSERALENLIKEHSRNRSPESEKKHKFVRGGVGDEALQPLLSFFSFESVTSLLEKVQRLLNVKDTTFLVLVFHLVTFLYMVYSFSRMSHTLLNTVGQQIEAREQGDKSVTQAAANPTAIQAAAKPDSEAKTPAVAAVKKGKKHTDKTDRPVDDDSGEGSSMPPDTQSGVKPPDTQSEAEATDDTQSEAEPTDTKSEAKSTGTRSGVQLTSTRSGAQPAATTSGAQPTAARAGARPTAARAGDTIESFSLKDLRGLRKDYTRRPDESIISWLVRLWDAAGEATILDGTEARHLGSLSHDPVIDQEMMREASPCSLWERVLGSVAQRYLCADDLYMQQTQWKTIEQGIQRLREMAVAEIVFSDDINTRKPRLAIMKRDETEETVLDMAKKLRTYADAVHGPTHARIAALETQVRGLADKIEENHKELKQDILQISAVQVRGSGTTRKRSLDREGKGIPRAKLWSFLRDCGENMKRWDGESTDAMTQRLHELLDGKTVEARENRVFWTVWIRWPGTSEPQKYEALVDTGAQCTLLPSRHVGEESVSIAGVTGGSQDFTLVEADVSLTGNEWKRHPIVTGPEAPCILGIDFLRNGYFKDPKGFRWAFGIAAVETEGVKQLNTLPGLSENPSAVGLLRVEEQQVPIATSIVHRRQYRTTRDAVIPIHKMIRELENQGVVSKTHSPFNSPGSLTLGDMGIYMKDIATRVEKLPVSVM
ncbi:hypothetical protein DUI87_34163 [Hirundo rustica rustica]|uniref:HSF-type DNA-binding domain-containing protein n=1 Tax=Hirundo rustica rustica TaxID=333673 RepID=A0A3M0IJ58_HIRRU|nr:hypothetical protein DUI87_34163 [Hirundo rustica rustica]